MNVLWCHYPVVYQRFLSLPGSDVGMCRICHEGGGGETLLSPCDCTGTLGKVHKSCLEKWLSSSNTSYCELCHTEFTIERRPQPLTQVRTAWLKEKWLWLCHVSPHKMETNKVHVKKTRQNVFSFDSLLIKLSLRLCVLKIASLGYRMKLFTDRYNHDSQPHNVRFLYYDVSLYTFIY